MPSVDLGLADASDFLSKARRERQRFVDAEDPVDRADHALNLAITIHHLADWTYRHGTERAVELGPEGEFLQKARNAKYAVKVLHKIADTAKHHTLTRGASAKIQVDTMGPGRLTVYVENIGIGALSPRTQVLGGRLLHVRTIVDDDEIIGYQSIFEGTVVGHEETGRFFEELCDEAMAFWQDAIDKLDAGRLPEWL